MPRVWIDVPLLPTPRQNLCLPKLPDGLQSPGYCKKMKFKTECKFLIFFTRHEWGRWNLKEVGMKNNLIRHGVVVSEIPYIRVYQERRCKNCFKIEQEIISD